MATATPAPLSPPHSVVAAGAGARQATPSSSPQPANIPWGYDETRVCAMAVDPFQLFIYWEVTDEAIAQAQKSGGDGDLVVRVYDTSNRIFDGTNAHSSFDIPVQRSDRQWFCHIGRPTSSAHVELGLRRWSGEFRSIYRSRKVDFPRAEPASGHYCEWMTVESHTGEIEQGPEPHAPAPPPEPRWPEAPRDAAERTPGEMLPSRPPPPAHHVLEKYWSEGGHWEVAERTTHERYEYEQLSRQEWSWQIQEITESLWTEHWHSWSETIGPHVTWSVRGEGSSWAAGPFEYPVEIVAPTVEHYEGPRVVRQSGPEVRVLHGPWQVVIRGINATASRRVLSTWSIHRSWPARQEHQRTTFELAGAGRATFPGSSERVLLGASEKRLVGASELRLGGASEVHYLGASDRRLGGGSELRFLGASQWGMRGSSERVQVGASERRLAGQARWLALGASERRLGGSEMRMGASERRLGGSEARIGASELRLGGAAGASEHRLGASESRLGASEGRIKPPGVVGAPLPFPSLESEE